MDDTSQSPATDVASNDAPDPGPDEPLVAPTTSADPVVDEEED